MGLSGWVGAGVAPEGGWATKRIIGLTILAIALCSLAGPRDTSAGHKWFVNHKGNVICVAIVSVPAHLAHGDVTRMMPCS